MSVRNIFAAIVACAISVHASAQVKLIQTVKVGDSAAILSNTAFDRFITRGSFCSLILDRFVFSESIAGSFMVDLSLKFNSDTQGDRTLRILFDDLVEIRNVGEPVSLRLSNQYLANQIPLANVADIDVAIRLIPVAQERYKEAYALITPLLGKPLYGIDFGAVFDRFAAIAGAGDKRTPLLFKATIPVPQNIIEAQRIEGQSSSSKLLLYNNQVYGIALEGAREVTDPTLVGKAKDFFNGVTSFVSGKNIIDRPTSSFRGAVSLRFTKDLTQALPDAVVQQLRDLSDAADQAYTPDGVTQVGAKAADAIKAVEALTKSKQIDARADFHLRGYVDMARFWAHYKRAGADGDNGLRNLSQWKTQFFDWYERLNHRGSPQLAQAYGVSEIYVRPRIAKIFIPYSLSDDMTLETVQRQISIHQALSRLNDLSKSEGS